MRTSDIKRKTGETDISLALNLDGNGVSDIKSGCGFMDHMLTLFAKHGRFNLTLSCKGDTQVDYHHSVEDIGICLGTAFRQALGNCAGIARYGSMLLPMDEALVLCAVDISGRDYLACKLELPTEKIGDFDCELIEEFLIAFVRNAGITLHVRQLDGKNSHHIAEAVFKGLARALAAALSVDAVCANEIPSTKGVLL